MNRVRYTSVLPGAALLSSAFLVVLLVGEMTSFSPNVEAAVRLVYRPIHLLCTPARAVSFYFWPSVGHHYRIENTVFASVVTGCAVAAAVSLWKATRRRMVNRRNGTKISRRDFLMQSTAGGFTIMAGGLGGYSTYIEPRQLQVRRYSMAVPDLPERFDGLRLLQFSDSHYGPFISTKYLRSAIAQANALEPDVLLLTGDYVHKFPETVDRGIGLLEELQSRYGPVSVMGNHEHWEGAALCRERFARTDIPLIENDRRFLTPEGLGSTPVPEESICIAGLGDLWEDRISYTDALRDVPQEMPRIVLAHNPDTSMTATANAHRVDFMCSGHTHGGQVSVPVVGPPRLASAHGQRFSGGICRGRNFPVIVSRGVGMAMLPIRFRVPPELVLITLKNGPPTERQLIT